MNNIALSTSSSPALLGEDGPFVSGRPDFEPRSGQQELSGLIDRAIDENKVLVVEAGTGIGKTYAYLVAVLRSGRRTLISTATKNLQDQLYSQDIPVVAKMLGLNVTTAILKGRNNYYCPFYAKDNLRHRYDLTDDQRAKLAAIIRWGEQSATGDLGEIEHQLNDYQLKQLSTSQTDTCLGQACPQASVCPLLIARARAQRADLVVVNHHLLLSNDLLVEENAPSLLPNVSTVIVDESHDLLEAATQIYGNTLSSRQWQRMLTDLRKLLHKEFKDMVFLVEMMQRVQHQLTNLEQLINTKTAIVWGDLISQISGLGLQISQFVGLVDQLSQYLHIAAPRSIALRDISLRVDRAAHSARIVLPYLIKNGFDKADGKLVCCDHYQGGFTLRLVPNNLKDYFQRLMENSAKSWAFVSATLSVQQKPDYFLDQLGLSANVFTRVGTPFNFESQALLYLPAGLPDPRDDTYSSQFANSAIPVLQANGGRTMCLFTSWAALEQCAAIFRRKLDYPLFVQGQRPKQELVKQFAESGSGVLLGLRSFWDGVDVPGMALSCLMIDKLPFLPPNDALELARSATIKHLGGDPFPDYQLPAAVIRLQQGVGRLIRTVQDRGVIVLADPRLISQDYGKVFLDSLPSMPMTRDITQVEEFFSENCAV